MQVRCKNWILDILEKCVTLSYHEHTNYQIARRVEGRSSKINKPVSDVVRESIRRYVAIEKFRAIRRKVLPFAEAQGFLTDEDVFKAIS